jgi:hypothetical protein
MGFNHRKMERCRATSRRASESQLFNDGEPLIVAWNERRVKRMPMLFRRFETASDPFSTVLQ